MTIVDVGICRVRAGAVEPTYATPGSLAMDFAAAVTTAIAPGEDVRVLTGIVVRLPDDYGLWLFPRSSFFRRHRLLLTNSVGLVDCDYCGPLDEIAFSYVNIGSAPVIIPAGERIGQGVLVPRIAARFADYDPGRRLSRGGFGSTGR